METQRTVVVLPGRSYGPYVPQLFFPMIAAQRRGAQVRAVCWERAEQLDSIKLDKISRWVAGQVDPMLKECDPASTVVIGKSLGSYAAPLVARYGLPAVWVTPVLISPDVVNGIKASPAPSLLVGGAADPVWDASLAFRLSDQVLEIPEADHSLMVADLARSATAMGKLATAAEKFLDGIGWTAHAAPAHAAG